MLKEGKHCDVGWLTYRGKDTRPSLTSLNTHVIPRLVNVPIHVSGCVYIGNVCKLAGSLAQETPVTLLAREELSYRLAY